ncbi:hypothetical protein Acr_00g0099510 [Actinidia rufa]|uniref:Uncharacterized protein n=1 Tax=Actinidia rufa TaxID=165716 RepID=A0A7J0E0N3_9ERIC|nr:hypothetical protein Acr_00g0099510 [Actinidia rufa]
MVEGCGGVLDLRIEKERFDRGGGGDAVVATTTVWHGGNVVVAVMIVCCSRVVKEVNRTSFKNCFPAAAAGEIRRRIGRRRTRGSGGQRWRRSESAAATPPGSTPALSGTTPSWPSCRRRTSPVTESARSTPASVAATRSRLAWGLWPCAFLLEREGYSITTDTGNNKVLVCGGRQHMR